MRCIVTVLLTLAIPITAAYGDGIVNGDFDGVIGSPPAAPWVTTGNVQIWPNNTDPGGNSQMARLGLQAGSNPASLSQTFACGEAGLNKVCNVGFWIVWFPNANDPGNDEMFEIIDGGAVIFSRTFAEPILLWTPTVLDFGDCGSQTITYRVSDPTDNTIESQAWVDLVRCSCDEPVPTEKSTWGAIKSLYEAP